MMEWHMRHPEMRPDTLGLIPLFLSESDPRPAREQLDEHYQHGGGWRPIPGFSMSAEALHYPEDPPFALLAESKLRDETIRFYDCSWVAIVQPDGTFEVCRMD